jgi:hypothetical protein
LAIGQEAHGWLLVRRCMVGYWSGGAWLAIGQDVPGWLLVRRCLVGYWSGGAWLAIGQRLPAFCFSGSNSYSTFFNRQEVNLLSLGQERAAFLMVIEKCCLSVDDCFHSIGQEANGVLKKDG